MRYNVHLYTQVRIKVVGVEAQTPSEAMQRADDAVDYQTLLSNPRLTRVGDGLLVEQVEWAEGITESAVVDPIGTDGATDIDHSVCLDHEGNRMTDTVPRASHANDLASLLEAKRRGFEVRPDPDQPGRFLFCDPYGNGSDISFDSELSAWQQIIAELPGYLTDERTHEPR